MKGICRGMNQGEVYDVIFLWYFLSNRKFGVDLTAGMGICSAPFLPEYKYTGEGRAGKWSTVDGGVWEIIKKKKHYTN